MVSDSYVRLKGLGRVGSRGFLRLGRTQSEGDELEVEEPFCSLLVCSWRLASRMVLVVKEKGSGLQQSQQNSGQSDRVFELLEFDHHPSQCEAGKRHYYSFVTVLQTQELLISMQSWWDASCRHIQLQHAIFVSLRDLEPHDHEPPPT